MTLFSKNLCVNTNVFKKYKLKLQTVRVKNSCSRTGGVPFTEYDTHADFNKSAHNKYRKYWSFKNTKNVYTVHLYMS